MGLRMNKSIKLGGGVRLNLSKKGVGVSAGIKGLRVGIGPRGVTKTASIPGTGIRHVTTTSLASGQKSKASAAPSTVRNVPPIETLKKRNKKINLIIYMVISIFLAIPVPFLWAITVTLGVYFYLESKKGVFKGDACYNDAIKLLKSGQIQAAVEPLRRAVAFNASDIQSRVLLIGVYTETMKAYDLALSEIDAAQAAPKLAADVRQGLDIAKAQCLVRLEHFNEALLVLQTMPPLDKISLLRAECHIGLQEFEIAAELLKSMPLSRKRTITPELIELKYLLGKAYLGMGDKRKAKTQLSNVYANDSSYRDVSRLIQQV